jgi:hypothetical protein
VTALETAAERAPWMDALAVAFALTNALVVLGPAALDGPLRNRKAARP